MVDGQLRNLRRSSHKESLFRTNKNKNFLTLHFSGKILSFDSETIQYQQVTRLLSHYSQSCSSFLLDNNSVSQIVRLSELMSKGFPDWSETIFSILSQASSNTF